MIGCGGAGDGVGEGVLDGVDEELDRDWEEDERLWAAVTKRAVDEDVLLLVDEMLD